MQHQNVLSVQLPLLEPDLLTLVQASRLHITSQPRPWGHFVWPQPFRGMLIVRHYPPGYSINILPSSNERAVESRHDHETCIAWDSDIK